MMDYTYSMSVLIVCYNPNYIDLMRTAYSVVMQQGIDFEIIVSDDGSETDYFDSLRMFFDNHDVHKYRFVKNKQNNGTVKNVLSGLRLAEGKYIRPISPGDFLYDKDTLKDIFCFMEDRGAKISFGNPVYFNIKNSRVHLVSVNSSPQKPELYSKKNYSYKKVKLHYLVYEDIICGISFAWLNETMKKYFELIEGKVIYAEDNILRIVVSREERIWYMDRYVVWYEYGTGISTDIEKLKIWGMRLNKDLQSIIPILEGKDIKKDFIIRQFLLLNKVNESWKKNMLPKIIKYVIAPELLYWKFRKNKKTNRGDLDMSALAEIVHNTGNMEETCSIN